MTTELTDLRAALDALLESETRFRAAFEENPETIGIFRPIRAADGRFVDAEVLYENRVGRERYFGGLPLNEIVGSPLFERWPQSRPLLFDLFAGFVERGGPSARSLHGVRPDGEYWAEVSLFPFDGGFVLVGRDETASMLAQRDARELDTRYRSVLDAMLDGVVILEPVRGTDGTVIDLRCSYINRAAITGPEPVDSLIGRSLLDLWPAAAETGLFAAIVMVLETGRPLTLEAVPYTDVNVDGGSPRVLDLRVNRVGDLIVGTWRDVTAQRSTADALAASEARYAQVVDGIPVGVYRARTTADGRARWDYVSDQCGRTLGSDAEQLVADPRILFEAIHPDDRAGLLEANRQAHREPLPLRSEVRLRHGDAWRIVRFVNQPAERDGDEQVWHGFVEDITEQRQIADALEASEARYAQLVEGIPVGVYRAIGRADGSLRFEYVSAQAGRILDLDPVDIARDPGALAAILEPASFHSLIAANVAAFGTGDRFAWEGNARVRGEWRTIRAESQPGPRVGDEQVWHGFIEDITEQRRIAQALARSEERYRVLAENANDVIWTMAPTGAVTSISPAIERVRGITPEVAMHQTMDEIHPPSSQAVSLGYFGTLLADLEAGRPPRPFVGELEYLHANGGTVWCEVHVLPQLDADGRLRELVGVSRDITERKRLEAEQRRFSDELERRVAERTRELEAANEELRSFSYSVSHDLRAPVRAVAGFARILQRDLGDQLDADALHKLDNIITAGQTMGRLIDDLLAYTRVGQGAVHREPVPLQPVLTAVGIALAERLTETGGTLEAVEPLPTPLGDRSLLDRIVLNLVDNAIAYRRPGVPPRIVLSATQVGDRVTVAVADNGIGIPPDAHERIFEVFTRLASGEEESKSGIGLATVRKAARAMGAEVTLSSVVGEGTTFRLTLPAADGTGHGADDPGVSAATRI